MEFNYKYDRSKILVEDLINNEYVYCHNYGDRQEIMRCPFYADFGDWAFILPINISSHSYDSDTANIGATPKNTTPNAAMLFYKGYNKLIQGVDFESIEAYSDDIIVYSKNNGNSGYLMEFDPERGVLEDRIVADNIVRLSNEYFSILKNGIYYLGTVEYNDNKSINLEPVSATPLYCENNIIYTLDENNNKINIK